MCCVPMLLHSEQYGSSILIRSSKIKQYIHNPTKTESSHRRGTCSGSHETKSPKNLTTPKWGEERLIRIGKRIQMCMGNEFTLDDSVLFIQIAGCVNRSLNFWGSRPMKFVKWCENLTGFFFTHMSILNSLRILKTLIKNIINNLL